MHQPRPHGRFFYGEGELGAEDAAAAELLVRRLTNHKGLGGLDSLKMARTLPSGATAVAVDAGGVLRLLIYQHQFQSTPVIADGRIFSISAGNPYEKHVSIHARHC